MASAAIVILLDKKTGNEAEIPARDFLHPHSTNHQETKLKPKTFHQAFRMLMDLLEGEIQQNTEHAVKLKGVDYLWDWSK